MPGSPEISASDPLPLVAEAKRLRRAADSRSRPRSVVPGCVVGKKLITNVQQATHVRRLHAIIQRKCRVVALIPGDDGELLKTAGNRADERVSPKGPRSG